MNSSSSSRLFQAAATLSGILTENGIAHAFHGGVFTVLLGSPRPSEEIFCIVEGRGTTHPFRLVRQALAHNEVMTAIHVAWSNRLYVKYHEPIPAIEFEVLPAGEEGPRRLDSAKIVSFHNVPFLNVTEFLRAKIRAWVSRGSQEDADHILFVMTRYWRMVDINRIPEDDMEDRFLVRYPAATVTWRAIKRRYG